MAREPELSIKVKVDPQIKPSKLKTDIEGQIKKSGEKPQIDIDPNVDGIKKKVEDKLKNIKATANITPVVDTEKLKTDIQQQINGIGDIPKITVGVNVDDFSDELSKRLKEELKTVNEKLSYYLKNLTTNTAGLNSVVEGLFPSRGISNAVQSELKSVQAELTAGLKGVKSKVKPFKETDLFQIGDTESTTTIRRVEKLVKNIREQFANLDNFYDADEEKFLDGFNSEFEKFQNNASETVEKLSALKKNLSKDKFSDLLDNDDFDAESTTKALTPLISFLKKLSTASIKTGEDYDNLYALFNNKNTNKLFDDSNDHLTRMKTRVGDITAETKTAIEVTGELAKTLNKAIKDDNSGYLSDAEIKTYGAAFDEVLSNIATKQEEINTKKQRTVELENDLLAKTRSNRETLRQELEEYKKLLKSFGVKGDEDEGNPKGKSKPKSKEPDKTPTRKPVEEPKAENQDALNNGIAKIQAIVFDINQEELQKSIDTIFAKVSAPIGFKPANGAIANIKQQLQEAFSDVEINATNVNLQNPKTEVVKDQTSIPGKVTITDADVIVDVKNPVSIPGTVTVDPNSVQLGNSDDLQKNANALSSVKQSLNKISTSAENYGTKIAAIGPSVQYVAQEVDNLSKSLENQITDLDIIAKKTDAYGTTANSIALNTKDVPVAGNPVGIPGKVTLKVEDVTPPKGSVKIPGKVELKDEDIKRPDPLKLNGSVKIKASDVKIDDVEISKKKFDINGNLILKNAEIVDAIKEVTGKSTSQRITSKNKNNDLKSINESKSRRSLLREFISVNKELVKTKNLLGSVADSEKKNVQKHFEDLKKQKTEIIGLLNETNTSDSDWREDRKLRYANRNVGYARLRHIDSTKTSNQKESAKAWEVNTKSIIANAKNEYIKAIEEIRKAEEDESKTESEELKTKIAEQKAYYEEKKRNADAALNRYNETANGWVQEARQEIMVAERKSAIKKLQSSEKTQSKTLSAEERAQKSQSSAFAKSIEDAQYKYSEKKFSGATDVRAALDSAEEAVAKLANIKLGTEEYARALENANNKWREAKHLISDFDGEQHDITKSINNMRDSAQKWLRGITGDTDAAGTLRETIQELISDIDNLDSDHSSEAFKTGLEAVKSDYTDAKHTVDNYTNDYKDLEKRANNILSQVRAAKRKLSKAGIDKYNEVLSGESKKPNTQLSEQGPSITEDIQKEITENPVGITIDANAKDVNEQVSQVIENAQEEATSAAEVVKNKIEQDVVEIKALIGEHAGSLTKPLVEEDEKQYSLEEARAAIRDVGRYKDYAVNKEAESYTPNEAKRAFDNLTKKSSSDAVEETGHFTPEEAKKIISSVTEDTTEAVKQQVDSISDSVKDLNESAKDTKDAVEDLKQETENITKSATGSESPVSGISTVINHSTVETDNFEVRLAALDKLDHQSKEYKDGLEKIIADWESTNKEINEAIDNEKKLNSVQEDRQKALDQIRAAIEKNSNNMDRARKNGSAGSDLYSQFNAKQTIYKALEGAVSSGSGVKDWAKTYFPAKVDDINNVTDALREMRGELTEDQIKLAQVSTDKSIERSTNRAATAVANLKSKVYDYFETNKKIQNSELAQPFRDLMNALNSENAPERIGELQKQFAELRSRSKELGLETENLIDKFEKLFGQHLSTMITMAALHKMQDALRIVYQNVVEIDTAVTELRKVSEYAGESLEEYMGRAAEQAQKLGVSISDYVNSTADWKRLGYSDEDAENLATYSTLLRNVGDGIDDVNTSSSYLISTLQGFGLLADQAEDVVNKIDAVANTQPVTANDLGEILIRSSAAMSAANNTLEETIALGTAANSVLQDADSVGTMMKSLSMYLRAAKSDAENAGIEVDGMANSVSELRSELKSLTGVDIMLDSKNFKSTYQIMKELSQVWSGLSDVTQANVTEMIGGKRNANAVSAILNNFDVAESAMESAANSANVAWEENEKYLDSIQGRLAQLDASFQALSQDVLSSDLVKGGVSFLTSIIKLLDKIVNLTGAIPLGLGIGAFATQLGKPKMTGFMIVPSNTPGGDTEQARCSFYWRSAAREYLVKPTNMVA